MSFFNYNGLTMFYEDIGVGVPIIFLHGSLSRGITAFASQIQAFQFSYRAIYPDLRGHGNTFCDNHNWNSMQLAEDILFLMDELNIPKAHIVGHSMGGDVAMYCAMNHPSRFHSIVSISSGGAVNESVTSYLERYNPHNISLEKYSHFIEIIKKDHFIAHQGDWQSFLQQTIKNCYDYPAFSEEDLRKISMPFLLIYGEQDSMVKQNEIDYLAKNIKNFSVYSIENAGHFPHTAGQNASEINQVIIEFIQNNAI